jgi:hypothetical protein
MPSSRESSRLAIDQRHPHGMAWFLTGAAGGAMPLSITCRARSTANPQRSNTTVTGRALRLDASVESDQTTPLVRALLSS